MLQQFKNTYWYLTTCFICGLAALCQAQNTDSLMQLLANTKQPAQQIVLYNQLANALRNSSPDSALTYYRKSYYLAKSINDNETVFEILNSIGSVWSNNGNIDSALHYSKQSLFLASRQNNAAGITKALNSIGVIELAKPDAPKAIKALINASITGQNINDPSTMAKVYNNLGLAYNRTNQYDSSIYYYIKSLKIKESLSDYKGIGLTTNNIALIYEKMGQYGLMNQYLKRSLAIRRSLKDEYGEAIVLNNFGLMFEGLNHYDSALMLYRQSLVIMERINNQARIATLYNNIGSILAKQKNFKEAYYYLERALEINIQLKNQRGILFSTLDLAEFFQGLPNYVKAIKFYKDAKVMAIKLNDLELMSRSFQGLSDCFEKLNYTDSSLVYYKQYNQLKDSLMTMKSRQHIEALQIEYQTFKTENENQNLIRENQIQHARLNQQWMIAVFLSLSLIFISWFTIKLNRKRAVIKKANELLNHQKNEIEVQKQQLETAFNQLRELSDFKETLSGMIVHDIKNPINTIINLSASPINNENADLIKHSGKQVLNLVLNILDVYKYRSTGFNLNLVSCELRYIIRKAVNEVKYVAHLKKINIVYPTAKDYLVEVDASMLERVFINLLTNAIKFAPQASSIEIKIDAPMQNVIKVHVIDKGAGIKPEHLPLIFEKFGQGERRDLGYTPSTGLGLSFCQMALSAHSQSIGVESIESKGSDFWFTLKCFREIQTNQPEQVHLIEPNTNPLEINNLEKEILSKSLKKLSGYKVYQVSEIKQSLMPLWQINSPTLNKHLSEINESVLLCNETLFHSVLDNLTTKLKD